jgi:hypothetical protein
MVGASGLLSAFIVTRDGKEIPANVLTSMSGGDMPHYKINDTAIVEGQWIRVIKKPHPITLEKALSLFPQFRDKGGKVKMTRHQRQYLKEVKIQGSEMTAMELFRQTKPTAKAASAPSCQSSKLCSLRIAGLLNFI